jgi:ribulose kinase
MFTGACGGGLKNDLFLRERVDISGLHAVLPREPEVVSLGAALLGAVAAWALPGHHYRDESAIFAAEALTKLG